MEVTSISAFFALGFGLGMLHAFDPDHIAAVTGVQAGYREKPGQAGAQNAGVQTLSFNRFLQGSAKLWPFSLRWALGHGAAILAIAACVFAMGFAIPQNLSDFAEKSISFLLIALGITALLRIFWPWSLSRIPANPQRSALLIGLVHGIAGSAPLLALIPLAKVGHPAIALIYVLLFSAGVLVAMTALGTLFSLSVRWGAKLSEYHEVVFRAVFALFSLFVGAYLLFF